MSRRRKTTLNTATHSDLGPLIQRERGDLVVVDATDPERPNAPPVRRAVRHPRYAKWYENGKITAEERNACDRYERMHEQMSGAVWRPDEAVGTSRGKSGGGPTWKMVQASAAITTAHKWIGLDAASLLKLFVIENFDIAEIAKRRNANQQVVAGMVLAAIRRLGEHWGENSL